MSRLDTLKLIVPDLVEAMEMVLKARPHNCWDRSVELAALISRIDRAYPEEILNAACSVAAVRFNRWAKEYRRNLEIQEFLR